MNPDSPFQLKPEWNGPSGPSAQLDVNLGHSPEAFVRAAYWQALGVEAPADFIAEQANKLRGLPYWRRIDVVNTILGLPGAAQLPRVYSDPWTAQPELLSNPVHAVKRDVGAVLMYFFNCPGGVNGGMHWANTHALGMDVPHALLGFGSQAEGYYDAKKGAGFFYRELLDARYAGLQFLLPNVYGPDLRDGSMQNLRAALERIDAMGLESQVKVGMFDDTWGWVHHGFLPWSQPPDLHNPAKAREAAQIIFREKWQPYFSAIPQKYWYCVKGKPLIYFYNGGTLKPRDNAAAVLVECRKLFKQAFGVEPFLAVDRAFFDDPKMDGVADSKFRWQTVNNDQPQNKSRDERNGIIHDHAMLRWDAVGRSSRGKPSVVADANQGVIKDGALLQALLDHSKDADLLVIATWNDLGEGTGINRNYDYYVEGNWQTPDYFMKMIRASQAGH